MGNIAHTRSGARMLSSRRLGTKKSVVGHLPFLVMKFPSLLSATILAVLLACQSHSRAQCPAPTSSEVSVSDVSSNSATLHCSVATPVIFYNYRYRRTVDAAWTTAFGPFSSSRIDGLYSESEYEYQVRVQCSIFETSDWSASEFFTTVGGCETPAEHHFEWVANLTYIAYQCNARADQYRWRWRVVGDPTWVTSDLTPANWADTLGDGTTRLAPGTDIEFSCQLKCGSFTSDWSVPIVVATAQCEPPTTAQIEADAKPTSLIFRCTAPAGRIRWRWRELGTPGWLVGNFVVGSSYRVVGWILRPPTRWPARSPAWRGGKDLTPSGPNRRHSRHSCFRRSGSLM